ncbi:MAG: prepilin-type N-terminal cleavage/methylation domain-containing protein [Clostridium sp.]|uniref:prepilin-type N-terminal cleavage/methylation domain-containing protein n=1 Tax=Clostridium sp. TaxID=1506 RepID=UPI0025C6B313|nr:competence type IV pilus minor pilin ComGF [Clostridium sp.]MCH3964164.1 prepilin-type N-terminal cleavage/methylation domain-containing protein [Clostridium sp.]MCI1715345.1 prepilin-type N-terminal cleavage/methylation domain-containing protein [Clostridium sp.]MCI1799864.1 prepilin-type N-terminal cleavage/methylation domain-containing protein [Clostridium sp.]MCI1813528.1 prepilin-type N-terminal cleavage/methylation domain-containing protein [Clostridium sp.]MCI1870682.1 prepilin-type 
MNFIKGILRDNVKRGFTIIEILMAMSIIFIFTSVQAEAILKYMKLNSIEIESSRDSFYVNEAFTIINSQIDSAKYIKIEDNMIALKRYDNRGWDYIKKNKNSSIVLVYGYTSNQTSNNILKDVLEFSVVEKKNLCYISIKTKRGNVYRRCLGINSKSVKGDSY